MATKSVAMGLADAVLHQTTLGKRQKEGHAPLDGMLFLGKPLTRASSLSWTSSLEMGMWHGTVCGWPDEVKQLDTPLSHVLLLVFS